MRAVRGPLVCAFLLAVTFAGGLWAQTATAGSAQQKLLGAWRLVRIDTGGVPGPQPKGMLIYTRDGHMSVQLMYPASAKSLSNEYVLNGYEASFGSYDVNEAAHTVTHHVQGSITGDLLVGKDLPRSFTFMADGRLLIRSTRPEEHWSVLWEHAPVETRQHRDR